MDKTELCLLAEKYKTDKCVKYRHNYTPYYYKLLSPYQSTFKNILEIGVGYPGKPGSGVMEHVTELGYQKGASLYMWREFFPNAMIYGIDIAPEAMFSDSSIQTILTSQTDFDTLKRLLHNKTFDLILDDGSHHYKDQVESFNFLHTYLNPCGIYIIEDCSPEFWSTEKINNFFQHASSNLGFKKTTLYDIRQDTSFKVNDDIFLFMQK